jgi:serine phosphatase RsbU (regulator of sigma subunit)
LKSGHLVTFLGDGLGHGPQAHIAIQKGISALKTYTDVSPTAILRRLHLDIKNTRGAVGSVAVYDYKEKQWQICGIGNIAFSTHTAINSKNYLSHNGILGLNIPATLKEQVIESERGQVLVMCSDGIKTRIDLQKFPGIFRCDVAILGAAIYKDYAKKNDDMSILTCRINN